jgi:hypothetical protein
LGIWAQGIRSNKNDLASIKEVNAAGGERFLFAAKKKSFIGNRAIPAGVSAYGYWFGSPVREKSSTET